MLEKRHGQTLSQNVVLSHKGKGTSFRSGSVRCIPCYNMTYIQAMGGQESVDLKIIINLLGMHLSQLVCCLNQEEGLKYATPLSP